MYNNYHLYSSCWLHPSHPKYKNGKYLPPFHNDTKMVNTVLNILKNMDAFIETGSYMGKTLFFVGKNFPTLQCYSCEINKRSFDTAYEQVKNLSNVNLDLAPSPNGLYNIKEKYDKDIFDKKCYFWLDAHWQTEPLYDELKYITSNFKKFCIFIDDFCVPWDKGFGNDGYNIEKIKPFIINKDKLKFYMPDYKGTDDCCKKKPVGYIVITNMKIDQCNNLREINI